MCVHFWCLFQEVHTCIAVSYHAEGAQGLPTPSLSGRSSNGSASSSNSGSSSDSDFDQAAAADSHLVQTAAAFGNLLSSVSQPQQQRYSLAGLGFGLPMSRLYARYFGECGITIACTQTGCDVPAAIVVARSCRGHACLHVLSDWCSLCDGVRSSGHPCVIYACCSDALL
jgi:hypothetical protein